MSNFIESFIALLYFFFFYIFICGFMEDLSKKSFDMASISLTIALMNLIIGAYFLINSVI